MVPELIAGFAQSKGKVEPSFTLSPHAVPGNEVFDRFLHAIRNEKDAPLEIAFHGTRAENIDDILQSGLDPNRRNCQKYGPGEYFSRQPANSSNYWCGGKKLLVFCVVVPQVSMSKSVSPDRGPLFSCHKLLPRKFV
jgi:hypothetical protein